MSGSGRESYILIKWRITAYMSTDPGPDPRIDLDGFDRGGANTVVAYLYRDADNFKQHETAILDGPITLVQARAILDGLDEADGFIPSAVGLVDLQDRAAGGWQADTDHAFHEISSISLTDHPQTLPLTAADFLDRFRNADWTVEHARIVEKYAPPPGGDALK